jgi:uncharacterized RDD family membrane protein YckC
MRIAYLTTDEVNHDLAQRTADGCGAILEVLALEGPTPERAYDAVLVDWDYLPADGRQPVLAALLAGQWPCPVAVHGHHLEDEVRHTLCQNGVAIHRRLEPQWLARWLCRVRRRPAGQWLPNTAGDRIPANVKPQTTGSAEQRSFVEEKMIATYPEMDRHETRTAPARSEDRDVLAVDWGNCQVTLPHATSLRPSAPRAALPMSEPAGRLARVVAAVLDMLLLLLPWAVGLFLLGDTLDRPEISILRVPGVQFGTLAVAIGQCVLLSLRGQTLGKLAVGVRIVRAGDGSNPGFWRAVVLRHLVPALVLWVCLPAEPVFYHVVFRHLVPGAVMTCLAIVGRFLAVAELLTFLKEDPRCLHDYLADTRVVEV